MKLQWICGVLLVMSTSGLWASGNAAVEDAREDLAERLQVPLDQITVISQTEKTWPNAGLGCEREGMMYAQVIVNGSQLVLEADGKRYSYHSGGGRPFFYCEKHAKK